MIGWLIAPMSFAERGLLYYNDAFDVIAKNLDLNLSAIVSMVSIASLALSEIIDRQ